MAAKKGKNKGKVGKVESMNSETYEVKFSSESEKKFIGKSSFTKKLFKVRDEIKYVFLGNNFKFIEMIKEAEELLNYPYNFVSLGEKKDIKRNLREKNKGLYTGKLKCTLTNISPMFIAGQINHKKNTEEYFLENGLNYIIPASTLKGEVRNIIEAFTHSCIRNIEDERLEKRLSPEKLTSKFGIIKSLPTSETNGIIVEAEKIKISREIIPKEYKQCSRSEELCFGCNLFGSVGNGRDNEKKEKTSLKGKVYFTDAVIKKENAKIVGNVITIKPLGEPHPSLSRFYLENEKTYDDKSGFIRGRKFYWHHKDKINISGKEKIKFEIAIEKIKDSKQEAFNSSVQMMKSDNDFKFEVTFKELTEEELGILIYGLELEEGMGHKIGKAKSFGLGSCVIKIDEILLKNKDRYKQFSKPYTSMEKEKKDDVVKLVKEKYIDVNKKEIKELKYILSFDNSLNFKSSPFPEEKDKNGNYNTLEWFKNNKDIKLPHILEYK